MKKNPILNNEFQAQVRIAKRRIDDGDGTIEHEAMVYAGDAIKGQLKALEWLLRRVIVTDQGEVLMTSARNGPSLKSLGHLYNVVNEPAAKLEAV